MQTMRVEKMIRLDMVRTNPKRTEAPAGRIRVVKNEINGRKMQYQKLSCILSSMSCNGKSAKPEAKIYFELPRMNRCFPAEHSMLVFWSSSSEEDCQLAAN